MTSPITHAPTAPAGGAPPGNTGLPEFFVSSSYQTNDLAQTISLAGAENPYTARIDFLVGVISFSDFKHFVDAVEFVCSAFNDEMVWEPGVTVKKGIVFSGSGLSVRKIMCAWNPPTDSQLGHGWLSIPGDALAQADQRDIWRVCLGLRFTWGFRATRIDFAVDDHTKSLFNFQTLVTAIADRNYGRFEYVDIHSPSYRRAKELALGWSIYCGSPQSDKRVVFYDKSVESSGQIDAYRIELRLKDKKADLAFNHFTDLDSGNFETLAPPFIGALVAGAVTFCDRTASNKLSECPILPWWQTIIDVFGGELRLSLPKPRPTLETKTRWILNQVAPTLAVLKEAHKVTFENLETFYRNDFNQFINYVCAEGFKRFQEPHHALIRVARAEREARLLNLTP